MGKLSRRGRWQDKQQQHRDERERRVEPPAPKPADPVTESPSLQAPPPPPKPAASPRTRQTACYVDFENVFFSSVEQKHGVSVPKIARHLNRLSRAACGEGWARTAVYANWDAIVTVARHAQDDWAMMGWRTIAVPTREDYVSQRTVKNLVDFVMSMDMLEDARDQPFDHFFIVSGDKDFCEVAERLKRLRKRVTVVALQPNLSWRLREAADDYVVWGFEDITGDEPLPMQSYRRLTQAVAPLKKAEGEDPYQVLLRAVRQAERDQGTAPVPWRVIRDEYFLRMTPIGEAEADKFAHSLADAGFVTLVRRKQRNGSSEAYLSVPG